MLEIKIGNLTILLAEPQTELATIKIMELINDLSKSKTPTLLYEFNSRQYWENLRLNEDNLNKSNIYIGQTCLLEDICDTAKLYYEQFSIKYLIIDSLIDITTAERYYLGRSDILSIIVKQLRKLAQEFKISIIITGPTNIDDAVKNIDILDIKTIKLNGVKKYQDEI